MLSPECTFILNINVFWVLWDPTLIYKYVAIFKKGSGSHRVKHVKLHTKFEHGHTVAIDIVGALIETCCQGLIRAYLGWIPLMGEEALVSMCTYQYVACHAETTSKHTYNLKSRNEGKYS